MRNEGQDCDYDKQKIKQYTESNRWVSNEWGTKDKIAVAFYLLFAVVTILSLVLCSVLSSVCRSHNLVLRSSFITHPSITFCVVFYLLFVVVTKHYTESRTRLWLRKQKIKRYTERRTRLWLRQIEDKHYTESNRWVSNEWGTKDNIVLSSSFITHPSITFCIVFYLLFVVVTILSFVPHSLLTHLLLSV
jgi:hypothetical protein